MTYTPEIFGNRLRRVREAKLYTPHEVENKLSKRGILLPVERLTAIENGAEITAFEFIGLSRLYNVTFEELCGEFDENRYRKIYEVAEAW